MPSVAAAPIPRTGLFAREDWPFLYALSERRPRSKAELDLYLRTFLGVRIPDTVVCPTHESPLEILWHLFHEDWSQSVIIAPRGGGKTFDLAVLNLLNGKFKAHCHTSHMGAVEVQAKRCYGYFTDMAMEEPFRSDLVRDPLMGETRWRNKSYLEILAGTFAQACLPGSQGVITDQGVLRLAKIVRERLPVRVKSWSFERERWEWQPVVGWYDNGMEAEFMRLMLEAPPRRGCPSHRVLTATPNHLVLRPGGGKTPLGELKRGDEVCVPGYKFSSEQRQVLLGLMLGDGSLERGSGRLGVKHGQSQRRYLDWLAEVFSGLCPRVNRWRSGVSGKQMSSMTSRAHPDLHALRERWYLKGKKRVAAEDLLDLGPLAFAIWLMDDGRYQRWVNNGRYQKNLAGVSGFWDICTESFSLKDHRTLEGALFAAFGLRCRIRPIGRSKAGKNVYRIRFSSEESKRILEIVAPYLRIRPAGKEWLFPAVAPGRDGLVKIRVAGTKLVRLFGRKKGQHRPQHKYDLTVAENHNYCVGSGLLVSNSGPHGQKAIVDEFEQLKWEVWQQFNKVPRSAHRIPAQMILASTHQVAVGTLHRVIEARTMPVHVFCWKEAVQRCVRPPEACQACKLKTVCCDRGSPARRAGGFIAIKDLEDDASRSDVESWRTQAECEEPGVPAGRIYHEYAEPGNLIYEALVLENRTLDLTADFNVHPIVWEINQVQPSGEVWAIDEICLRGVGTKQAAQEFVRRYKGHPGGYRIYGDATGSGRSTKTDQPGVTDYTMMREVFKGLEVDPQLVRWRVPEENPRRRDRYNAMNGMFCNLQGERRLKVHATKCPMLRSDLKYGAWQGGSMVEDESDPDRGHAAAAEGYYISRDYPALGAGARPVARPVGGIAGAQVRGIQQAYGGR